MNKLLAIMNNWREELNRLAVEFWFGIGSLPELLMWVDIANTKTGEVHPDVWDLYTYQTEEEATNLLLKIAKDVNEFIPGSVTAEPLLIKAFRKALTLFLSEELSVQELCKLVDSLDTIFVFASLTDEKTHDKNRSNHLFKDYYWIGDLWNCCDWLDENWTFNNSQPLVIEARQVLAALANK